MRFLLLLLTCIALFMGLFLAGLYGFTPYSTMQAELTAANHAGWAAILPQPLPQLAHTAARYALLRGIVALAVGAAAVGLGCNRGSGRREARRLGQDIGRARQALGAYWRGLSGMEQGVAVAVLLLITTMRIWLWLHCAFNPDELVSSDYFVLPGPRVTASFYTLPNNHILYNLLSGPLQALTPTGVGSDLLLRLPSLVLALLATALTYAVLSRLTSFRAATFALCLIQLTPLGVEYTVSARGYGLQAACVHALFLAVLVLLRGPACHRLAWAVLVLASLAGFYLIPTFIYPFTSLGAALLVGLGLRRSGKGQAGVALVAGAGVLLLTALLYLPVGLLSGWTALLANPYVARLSATHFWAEFGPYYLWTTIGTLLGNQRLTLPPLLLLLTVGPLLVRRWAPRHWPVAALAWAGVLGPLPLLMLQQVFAPARTLHYVVLLVALLAGLALEALAQRLRLPDRTAGLVLLLGLSGYAAYRLPRLALSLEPDRKYRAQAREAYQWIQQRQRQRVFTNSYGYHLYLRHLALAKRQQPLLVQLPIPGQAVRAAEYELLLLARGQPLPDWAARQPYRPVHAQDRLIIYQLEATPARR